MMKLSHSAMVLATLLVFSLTLRSPGEGTVTQATVDLNGDRKPDAISFTLLRNGDGVQAYELHINGSSITEDYEDCSESDEAGFRVVDIDPSDTFKEITVRMYGPSDLISDYIYAYNGKQITEMASLEGADFPGKGLVYAHPWCGFWSRTDRYLMDTKTHRLIETLQPFYYVGATTTVKKSFPIYKDQKLKSVIANVREKSTLTVVLYDDAAKLYLVKSESGIVGYTNHAALLAGTEILELP